MQLDRVHKVDVCGRRRVQTKEYHIQVLEVVCALSYSLHAGAQGHTQLLSVQDSNPAQASFVLLFTYSQRQIKRWEPTLSCCPGLDMTRRPL